MNFNFTCVFWTSVEITTLCNNKANMFPIVKSPLLFGDKFRLWWFVNNIFQNLFLLLSLIDCQFFLFSRLNFNGIFSQGFILSNA